MPLRFLIMFTSLLLTGFIMRAQPSVQYVPLPDTTSIIAHDFSFLDPGTTLLSYRGGVLLPELGFWLIEPRTNNIILSAISNQPGSIYTLSLGSKGMELEKRSAVSDTGIQVLSIKIFRQGLFSFYQSPDRKCIYLFGRDKHIAAIYRLNAADKLETLLTIPDEQIGAMYCENAREFLIATSNSIWRCTGTARYKLLELPDPIEGLACTADGGMIVATPKGTFKMVAGAQPVCISPLLHGPLHICMNKLYILSLQHNLLACITPDAAGSYSIH